MELDINGLLKANVAVHNGPPHADEVVAVALLKALGHTGTVVRTRDPAILKDLVGIDVAGSATGDMFDHHGPAAAPDVCALTKLWAWIKPQLAPVVANRFEMLMGESFTAIASIDSGVSDPIKVRHMFGWTRFVTGYDDDSFFKAVDMATVIIAGAFKMAEEWAATLSAATSAMNIANGGVPVFTKTYQGAKEALHSLGYAGAFFISPHGPDEWAVCQACPVDQPFSPFGGSKTLPSAWAGLRGEELAVVSGLKSAKFAFAPNRKDVVMAFFGSIEDAKAAAAMA